MRSNQYSSKAALRKGFRSGFESEVSEELKSLRLSFEYESDGCKFKYYKPIRNGVLIYSETNVEYILSSPFYVAQECTYTCDFLVTRADGGTVYIETKGMFTSKDRTKHLLLKKQHPNADIRLLFSSNGKVSPKTRYMDWAKQHGIIAAVIVRPTKTREGRMIPKEWLE